MGGRAVSGAVAAALLALGSLTACGGADQQSSVGAHAPAPEPIPPAAPAAGKAVPPTPQASSAARVPYVLAYCRTNTGLEVESKRLAKRLETSSDSNPRAQALDVVDIVRGHLTQVSDSLQAAEPPTFEGAEQLVNRVQATYDESIAGVDDIRRTMLGLDPAAPDYKESLAGQTVGVAFALLAGPLSLVDTELAKSQGLSGDALARASAGYLGFLREARDEPECAWVLKGSEDDVARLLD